MNRLSLFVYFFALWGIFMIFPSRAYAEDIHRIAEDRSKAVFFIYYHVGEDQYPSSNLQIEQFAAHVQELKEGEYNVLPVPEIVAALKAGKLLPHHTVGVTLEGAYRSSFENAIPLLLEHKIPFTLFIVPERIDRKADYYMTWKEIKKLSKNDLVTIGALPFSYQHMATLPQDVQQQQWGRSISRFRDMLGDVPQVFAWPYGEYNVALKTILKNYNFSAGFSQHSGVSFHGSDMMALPRFSMTDQYGDLDRFRLAARSFPFPALDEMPSEMILGNDKPQIGFSLRENLQNTDGLSCFISDLGRAPINRLENGQITIALEEPLLEKRIRMNCTLPVLSPEEAKQNKQYWRWYGRLFVLPEEGEKSSLLHNTTIE